MSRKNHLGLTPCPKALRRRPRVGVYGGQFDCIHYGHLLCAEWARRAKRLDKVLFVTCGESPNGKYDSLLADDRHEMVVAATAGNPFFEACRTDIVQRGTSYMLNTVEGVVKEWGDAIDIFVMVSSEYLNPAHGYWLPQWIGFQQMLGIDGLRFLVFPRDRDTIAQIGEWRALLPKSIRRRVKVMHAPSPPLSSTMIRDWTSKGRSISYMTTPPVQEIIRKKSHYLRPGQTPCKREAPAKLERVGLFPGQFDPIHFGHLLRAECARQEHSLDRVVFVTSATPPNNRAIAYTAEDRHDMVVAATADNPYFDAWRCDIDSGKVSYTLQTVEEARRRLGKEVELFVLLRAEYLNPAHTYYLPRWFGADELFALVRFIAFPNRWTEIEQVRVWARGIANADIEVLFAPIAPVSSEDIRTMVAAGESTLYCTPGDVRQIIAKRGLYGGRFPLRGTKP